MPATLSERICCEHYIDTSLELLSICLDQGLMHDATATSVCLQLEVAGIKWLAPTNCIYCDHNLLQINFRNADGHRYLRDMSRKLGMVFSAPDTGIGHQTHLEEAVFPGGILLEPIAIQLWRVRWACWPLALAALKWRPRWPVKRSTRQGRLWSECAWKDTCRLESLARTLF